MKGAPMKGLPMSDPEAFAEQTFGKFKGETLDPDPVNNWGTDEEDRQDAHDMEIECSRWGADGDELPSERFTKRHQR